MIYLNLYNATTRCINSQQVVAEESHKYRTAWGFARWALPNSELYAFEINGVISDLFNIKTAGVLANLERDQELKRLTSI